MAVLALSVRARTYQMYVPVHACEKYLLNRSYCVDFVVIEQNLKFEEKNLFMNNGDVGCER